MAGQQRLGQFWLAWRTDRDEWAICWNDSGAGTRRRKSTGIGGFNDGDPPREAQEALTEHFKQHGQPEAIDPRSSASVSRVMTLWLTKDGVNRARAMQYGYAVAHLQRWLDSRGPMRVDEINTPSTRPYIDFRLKEGVKGETIASELAALQRAFNWAEAESVIPFVPKVAKVPSDLRSEPKDVEYSHEQVAALLEAATGRFDRLHVATFAMIMLSTHGRVEAILEAFAEQHKDGLLYTNEAGRKQTTKRRSVVPVVPTLKRWLPKEGKLIVYRTLRKDGTIYERPTYEIKNAFAGCLKAAGIVDADGEPWGSPNALRHTIHTQLNRMGVPNAQIDLAAGHSGERGSGRNYTHLRPDYLKEFRAGVERYWREMDKLTSVHRSQFGPNRFDFKTGLRVK